MMDAETRFWKKVNRSNDGCWEWTGARTKSGYGELGVNRRMWYAHRFGLHLEGIDIPSGLVVDHICRNRSCVRPDHLRLATHADNILSGSGASARNLQKTHCPKGHAYDDENTWVNAKGHRYCRECRKEYNLRNQDRLREYERQRYLRRRSAEGEAR